jgi:hypothetical protein
MEIFFIICVALMIAGSFAGSGTARARDLTQSYYDQRGSFAGSSNNHGKTESYFDKSGKFSGSAIRNSDGTTSYFGADGKFRGSSSDTTQPK